MLAYLCSRLRYLQTRLNLTSAATATAAVIPAAATSFSCLTAPSSFPSPPPPPRPMTPSPPLPPVSPPPLISPKKVYCKNKYYPHCYRMEHYCPSACPHQYCNKPGAVCQDPRSIGDGITFYFHGKKDHDFFIVSDSNLHVNAHFVGRRNEKIKRDFTWVQSLGILFDTHQLFIGAMKTAIRNDAVDRLAIVFDGKPVIFPEGEGSRWQPIAEPAGLSITRSRHTNGVVIEVEVEGNFKIKATVIPIIEQNSRVHNYVITEEDCFAHLDLGFKFNSLSGYVNGVLGQTYSSSYVSRVKMSVAMPVLGGDKEFASSSFFATDCAVARFSGHFNSSQSFEYANLNCGSGLDGRGVFCKR
ncbi:hypothetical protein F0562_022237 [Nyssa sinensis]|uniref:Uncharacterized protein n=1 Tax=Nyssa sinensis TaxID=561372 RepID=A0A5J5BM59_9ASTE|nr:hypothetical protein F0562_022237 [Nyssa sinensis]